MFFFYLQPIWPRVLIYCTVQRCCLCSASDSTVSEYAGVEPRTVSAPALELRCSDHSARSQKNVLKNLKGLKIKKNFKYRTQYLDPKYSDIENG
jgi:hypothetical protein